MQPEHRQSVGDVTVYPTTITDTGALSVASGVKTGRVPKEKRIVYDDTTKNVSFFHHFLTIFQKQTIWWGDVNIKQEPIGYERNKSRAIDCLNTAARVGDF